MADPQIDLSAGLVPKTPTPDTGGIDLSAGLVPKSTGTVQAVAPDNVNRGPAYDDPTKQPGFFDRAYETSGIKGLVDQAKAKGDQEEAVRNEAMAAIKAGKYGHAAETLLRHVAGGAVDAVKGPAGQIIEGAVRGGVEHGKAAISAAREGKTGEAIENAAEAVPLVGQVGEQIAKPLGTDIGSGNIAGAAGDVAGGVTQYLAGKALGKAAGTGLGAAAKGAAASAEDLTPKAQSLKAAGETVQKEAAAVRETAGKNVGAAKEAVAKSLPMKPSSLLEKGGKLSEASNKVLQDTADAEQLAGAKDPDMADVRAMADHLSKGKNAAGEPLNLDPEKIDSMKRAFDQKIGVLQDKAAAGGNATALRHVKNLKSAYLDSVYDGFETHGDPAVAQTLRTASKEFAKIVSDQTEGPAQELFKTDKPEEIPAKILNANARAQSATESLMRNMSKEGKEVLRDSVAKEIYRKTTLPDGTIDGVKARKMFYGLGDTAKALYGPKLPEMSQWFDAISKETLARNKGTLAQRTVPKITQAVGTGAGAVVGGTPGAIVGGEIGRNLGESFVGKSGAVKIGISPTEKIVLSPSQAAASRPLITKFLKAKAAGNTAALVSAYNAIANPKPEQNKQ